MKRFIWVVFCGFMLAGFTFTQEGLNAISVSKEVPNSYENVLKTGFMNQGDIVEGDLNNNFGAFEEEYHTTYGFKTGESDYTYVVEFNNKYIGVKATTKDFIQKMEEQANQTIDFVTKKSSVAPGIVHFKGRIVSMGNDEIEHERAYLVSMGYSEQQAKQLIYPFMIECADFADGKNSLGIGIACFVLALLIVIPTVKSFIEGTLFNVRNKKIPINDGAVTKEVYDTEQFSMSEMSGPKLNPFDEARDEYYANNKDEDSKNDSDSNHSSGLKLRL
ncbi:MAG: hypothetical protein Q4D51_05530 [Eubacteriales bacterium]|nr:hypothetical protein [Eubacteriales bacterium]